MTSRPPAPLLGALWRQSDPAWFELGSTENTGFVQAGPLKIGRPASWVLDRPGHVLRRRAFPYWMTIPSRYAWPTRGVASRLRRGAGSGLAAYMVDHLANRTQAASPSRPPNSGRRIWVRHQDHARLRFPTAADRCATTSSISWPTLRCCSDASAAHLHWPRLVACDGRLALATRHLRRPSVARSLHHRDGGAGHLLVVHAPWSTGWANQRTASMITGFYRLPSKPPASSNELRNEPPRPDRGLSLGAGGLLLGGCDRLNANPNVPRSWSARRLHLRSQRLLAADWPASTPRPMSPGFRTNGNIRPASADYRAHACN